jgi:transposase
VSNSTLETSVGGDTLSQGAKDSPEPALFLVASEIYKHIPKRHFYKQLGELLDLSFVYELTKPLYALKMGRPSLDPTVFFKCMLIGFFENIVYDLELEYRLADSLTFRQFLGYGLDERTPDESTLRKTRQRMPVEAFEQVFDYVLDICQSNDLLRGRAIGTDGSAIDANASMDSLCHKELGCTYEGFMLAMRRQDVPEATKSEAIASDRNREGKASNRDWESKTDPESRVIQHADGHTHLSYKVDTSVDLETGIIVCAGASLANISDQADFLERVDEVTETLSERGLQLEVMVADKGHHSGENLAGLEDRELVGLISSPKKTRGAPGFRREDFRYCEGLDALICPVGQILTRRSIKDKNRKEYRARGSICRQCPHFGVCTVSKTGRAVVISAYEDLILANRERVHSEAARPLMQIRRQRGEAPFGYFKMFGGLRRFAGRGLAYAVKKTLIAALGWNLLLLVKKLMRREVANAAVTGFIWLCSSLLGRLQRLLEPRAQAMQRADRDSKIMTQSWNLVRIVGLKSTLSGGC